MANYAEVILAFATVSEIDRPFTYQVPEVLQSQLEIGQRIKVPFGKGNRLQVGYIVGLLDTIPPQKYRLKSIVEIIDEVPLLDESQLKIIQFIVAYYGTSYAAAIDVVLPPGLKDEPIKQFPTTTHWYQLNDDAHKVEAYYEANKHKQSFFKQGWIIKYLKNHGSVRTRQLEGLEEVSLSSLKTLQQKEIVQKEERTLTYDKDPINEEAFKILNIEQQAAVDYLKALNEAEVERTILLEGVTGSGKTEVFLHAIWNVLRQGGTAIVLVPEIALTAQTIARFEERFGNQVALTHSRMGAGERQRLYMRAKMGEISVVIGPRSAVFMPLPNLKLIVIDEAHENSYKSEVDPKYHAIDVAKERMRLSQGQVLLATATPSLESYYEVQQGQYDLLKLTARVGQAMLPEVTVIDMRLELASGNNHVISRDLFQAIDETVRQDKQVMLLINRRGHSTFINCRSCGYVVKCEHCDVAMTYHASTQSLQCHYCGKTQPVPQVCPACQSPRIRFFGNGTEKIEAFMKEHFGEYGVLRMDTDTTTGKEGHRKILEAFRHKKSSILIGTQMIAKGHDFPEVTLVGILSADAALFMQDFRSNEKSYQLFTQAIGRAGRGEYKGRVMIQTYNPEHFVIEVVQHNQQALFYKQELMNRQLLGYPPYSHMFTILMTGGEEREVIRCIQLLDEYYRHYSERGQNHFRVIGPSPAVISKVGDEYRWRLLVLGDIREKLLIYGKYCLEQFYKKESTSSVKIQWEIDPISMI